MKRVISVILGGGQGSRLFPLTKFRSKPAVPLGGKYRLVDIPVSNCLHAGLDRIYVLTQFNSASLNRHITKTYRFDAFTEGFVEILAAEQTLDNQNWYQGTADAVRHHLKRLQSNPSDQVLILSGDHVYQMDYRPFIQGHRKSRADISIAVKPVTREEARQFGILKINSEGRIIAFHEKPQTDEEIDRLVVKDPPWSSSKPLLASMGIYVFNHDVLENVLTDTNDSDFGRHIIPKAIHEHRVFSFLFDGYWEDIGTIQAFYRANIALTDPTPDFDLFRTGTPFFTRTRHLPGSRMDGCTVHRSIVNEGCDLRSCEVSRSIIGIRSVIRKGAVVKNTIMMGADFYETQHDLMQYRAKDIPCVGIGARTRIENAIIDKNARIGEDVVICNQKGLTHADEPNYYIREGLVLIPKNGVIPNGSII